MNFPIAKKDSVTDSVWLYRSLGSFWTDVFQEKETLKGYTKAQAEEITQRYLDLIEAIDNYSVEKSHTFHRVKWKPLFLYKSKINEIPFVFEENDAIFGAQATSSVYYGNVTFSFGKSKVPSAKVYQYAVGKDLVDFGIIADQILDPSIIMFKGTDVVLTKETLIFNKDVFNDSRITKFDVFDDSGNLVFFKDKANKDVQEQLIILWAYEGYTDKDTLFNTFGYIFNYRDTSSVKYKEILTKLTAIYTQGPSVNAIKRLIGIFADVPYILSPQETYERSFVSNDTTFIVTDRNVYPLKKGLTPIKLTAGQVLSQGSFLAANLVFFDNQSSPHAWWKNSTLVKDQLLFSKYLFQLELTNQIGFSSNPALVTLNANGDIVFPVVGVAKDVEAFNAFLNSSTERKELLKTTFNLVNPGDNYLVIPLDFVMQNFFKANTAFFRITLPDQEAVIQTLRLVPLMTSVLPPYVYFIIASELTINTEVYSLIQPGDILGLTGNVNLVDGYVDNVGLFLNGDAPPLTNAWPLFTAHRQVPELRLETVYSADLDIVDVPKVIAGTLRRAPQSNDTTASLNHLLFLDFS